MIPESLRLATAGGVDLAKTNTIMANAMRSFSLEADQANEVSNVLTATFTTTNTTLESLSQTIKNAAGVLGTVGVKIEEVSAAAGVLGDVGVLASVAGTGLKNYGIKLAKVYGITKDATKSAKEYFDALGITKDRLFDAETGTFDMVEATIAFKEAMNKLGKAKAPEFLARFSTLFGERAAVSLTSLVKKAEQFKIQAENVRMTEMIGDVQQTFEGMRNLGDGIEFASDIQKGLSKAVESMLTKLPDGKIYMEEFANSGIGATGVIDRLSKSFMDTQQILKETFGKNFFSETKTGLIEINEYSKNGAVSMTRLSDVLKELDSQSLSPARREELNKERIALEQAVISGKKDISQLTDQGRARLLDLASLREYIKTVKESNDGTSKSANQIKILSEVFKGNSQNVAMAARSFGISLDKNEKLKPSLREVAKEMDKMSESTEGQMYTQKRFASQVAFTNTTMDMQAIQLNTLKGIMEIFSSGLEQIQNSVAQALTPALSAATKAITNFMPVLTMSSDEIREGVSVTDKLGKAWQDTIRIFTDGESIFARIKTGFEGLSSVGKTFASAAGILGATGIAAGGAFVWVQALLPALGAMSTAFFSIVLPVTALVTILVTIGNAFKNAYEQAKILGDITGKSTKEILDAYNSTKDVIDGVKSKLTELDAEIIKNWSIFKESIDKIKNGLGSLMAPLEKIAGLTNTISVTGGRLTIFGKNENGAVAMQDTIKTINKLLIDMGKSSTTEGKKLQAALKSGDSSMISKSLLEVDGLMEEISKKGLQIGFATKNQQSEFIKLNNTIKGRKDLQEEINKKILLAKSGSDGLPDAEGRIAQYQKDDAKVQAEINKFTKERSALQQKIVSGQGKTGKLTNNEVEDLKKLQKLINDRSGSVGELKLKQESLLRITSRSKEEEDELVKTTKKLKGESSLLVENQLKYNKILDAASSRNPFSVLIKAISEISKTEGFKKIIGELSGLISSFAKYIVDDLVPRISVVVKSFFALFKSSTSGTIIPIIRLIKSIGGLIGDLVLNSLELISGLFDYINESSGGTLSKTGDAINIITRMVEGLRKQIVPFMEVVGAIAINIINMIRYAISKIGPPIWNLIKSLVDLFDVAFATIKEILFDVFGVLEGKSGDVFSFIGDVINKVADYVERLADALRSTDTKNLETLGIIGLSIIGAFKLMSMYAEGLNKALAAKKALGNNPIVKFLDNIIGKLFKGQSFFGVISKGLSLLKANLLPVAGWLSIIIAVAGSLYEAWQKNYGGMRDTIRSVASSIMKNIGIALVLTFKLLGKFGKLIGNVIAKIFNIGKAFAPIVGPIVAVITKIVGWMINNVINAYNILALIVGKVIDIINGILDSKMFKGLIGIVSSLCKAVYDIFASIWKSIFGDGENKADGWFKKLMDWVVWIYPIIEETVKEVWKIIDEYGSKIFEFIIGYFEFISALFSGSNSGMMEALIKMYKAVSDIAIKIEEKVMGVIDRWVGAFKIGVADVFDWFNNKAADIVEHIPLWGGKGKADKMRAEGAAKKKEAYGEGIALIDGEVNKKRIADKRKEVDFFIEDMQKRADEYRKEEEKTAIKLKDYDKLKKTGLLKEGIVAKNNKEKQEKQDVKKQENFFTQIVKNLDTSMKNNTDSNKDLSSKLDRPNVTNNTYVEYRAAEDDEVNRRMIERVMNNILKADIGLMMGDTAGMSTD